MRDPLLTTVIAESIVLDDHAAADAAPANRAARRGRSGKKATGSAVHAGATGRARAAQGRRINPVRRTG
ncbi:hypothetical protein [Pseudonocardia nigra]|uniref:hypothetical protein n=1 Tax=Pseudonocardia nigra TaxID=1921578 RepID=UPI001C5D543C|nr:hypothetical protein [Pseudonocardia nigra]